MCSLKHYMHSQVCSCGWINYGTTYRQYTVHTLVGRLLGMLSWILRASFFTYMRSCQNDLNGAIPVPGPTMMMGTRGSLGMRKAWALRIKHGITSPRSTLFSHVEHTPLWRGPIPSVGVWGGKRVKAIHVHTYVHDWITVKKLRAKCKYLATVYSSNRGCGSNNIFQYWPHFARQ